ncbi:hypothetical protein [Nodosilinea nodulosa]|uniref:hypothetical protein n=1 Tax=Nodosilinea nodulosa TaxID=416001 RepID=UPI00030DFEBA|nr:hypothetical protein [Nodosilinea nodulosa]
MEYWEFLLQKEGDQSWLPLDASQVEILEGRYRVMAHTSQTNTPVRIQISQVLLNEQRDGQRVGPKRRTLRRRGQTNNNGLMVVMPFTRLREGTWDIQCASDGNTDRASVPESTPQPWGYAVQLRVVAQDSADDGDWFADDGREGTGAIAASPLQSESWDTRSIPPVAAIDLPVAAAAMDAFQAQLAAGLATDLAPESSPYELALSHTALLGSEGERLTFSAMVRAGEEAQTPLTLVVRLSDPQTAATVALVSVPVATLTGSIPLAVVIPPGLATRLLLGEVGLLAEAEVVAVQRFTVTVDVASLFDAIANQAEADNNLDVVFPSDTAEAAPAAPPPDLDLKTWDLAGRAAPPREMPILTLPRSSPALPPKIYYPSPHEAAAHQPTLPPVGRPNSSSSATFSPQPEPEPTGKKPPAAPGPSAGAGLSLPPISSPAPPPDPIAALRGQPPTPSSRPNAREPQLISHEAMGFKDLKLQDRFWARLNELAVNLRQEALENRADELAEADQAVLDDPAEAPPEWVPFAGEVVIYEDEDPTLKATTPLPEMPDPGAEVAAEAITPPMPSLMLPEGDLIAGEPVLITLRVPFHPNRLYIKVWITDPQTRSLADEPRQVMNLLPNGQGQMEGTLQLTVPLGCLEAWFEAISVDMLTQQESYKASVSRAITPAGLPSPGLDEFQL